MEKPLIKKGLGPDPGVRSFGQFSEHGKRPIGLKGGYVIEGEFEATSFLKDPVRIVPDPILELGKPRETPAHRGSVWIQHERLLPQTA